MPSNSKQMFAEMLEDDELAPHKDTYPHPKYKKPVSWRATQYGQELAKRDTQAYKSIDLTEENSDQSGGVMVSRVTAIDPRLLQLSHSTTEHMEVEETSREDMEIEEISREDLYGDHAQAGRYDMVTHADESMAMPPPTDQQQITMDQDLINRILDAAPEHQRQLIQQLYEHSFQRIEHIDRPALCNYLDADMQKFCTKQYFNQTFICSVWMNYDTVLKEAYHDKERKSLCGIPRLSKTTRNLVEGFAQRGLHIRKLRFKVCTAFRELAFVDFRFDDNINGIRVQPCFKSHEHTVVKDHISHNMEKLQRRYAGQGAPVFGVNQLDMIAQQFLLKGWN